jgi:23S rRNA (guanosine2251-2'-O)-methyltransferase
MTEEYELLYGKKPIYEALRGFRKVFELYGTDTGLNWLRAKMRETNTRIEVPIRRCSKEELHNLIKRPDHQGLVAKVFTFQYTPIDSILDNPPRLILICDGITDPHNLGATIRSAQLCGVGAIVIPRKNSAGITPVVAHTSAGATEHTPIIIVDSLLHTIEQLKIRDFFVVAAEKPSKDSLALTTFKPPERVALIIGSEGEGVGRRRIEKCDAIISIQQGGKLDSFNVSVAAGIVLHYLAVEMGLV